MLQAGDQASNARDFYLCEITVLCSVENSFYSLERLRMRFCYLKMRNRRKQFLILFKGVLQKHPLERSINSSEFPVLSLTLYPASCKQYWGQYVFTYDLIKNVRLPKQSREFNNHPMFTSPQKLSLSLPDLLIDLMINKILQIQSKENGRLCGTSSVFLLVFVQLKYFLSHF